jgi:hypothetical protein
MREILGWPPAVWTLRLAFVIVVGGAAWIVLLYAARFLRPKHVWRMLRGQLPEFQKVGATAKLLGQELSLQGELTERYHQELEYLDARLKTVELQLAAVARFLEISIPNSNGGGKHGGS